ncbi:hypothetical protein CEK71_00530 [Methylovulum psychrotolerans]|uniref:Uncharacterized protein n=1 Tax=Methylovulum psychrotolerans TaxID=1704499 RepID=A0A1Z4BTT0_9GAMM|nr:hypothetical protein CEK71_00530 [Methylovulum psychrotolerans]
MYILHLISRYVLVFRWRYAVWIKKADIAISYRCDGTGWRLSAHCFCHSIFGSFRQFMVWSWHSDSLKSN